MPPEALEQVWALTGDPGVGKSTLVSKVVYRLKSAGVIVGGCSTVEKKVKGVRVGFGLLDLTEGRVGELASVSGKSGPRVGRYRVNLEDLARVGAGALTKAADVSEVIVIDEVGPMELVSPEFRRAVKKCLQSGKPTLAVVHQRMEDDLISEVKSQAKVEELTTENRDTLTEDLGAELLRAAGGPKVSS